MSPDKKLYRLRFIIAGVCILLRHRWPLSTAWRAVADDFDNDGLERHEGYTPEESAKEALSYWD
jgi:hypothetical protein